MLNKQFHDTIDWLRSRKDTYLLYAFIYLRGTNTITCTWESEDNFQELSPSPSTMWVLKIKLGLVRHACLTIQLSCWTKVSIQAAKIHASNSIHSAWVIPVRNILIADQPRGGELFLSWCDNHQSNVWNLPATTEFNLAPFLCRVSGSATCCHHPVTSHRDRLSDVTRIRKSYPSWAFSED